MRKTVKLASKILLGMMLSATSIHAQSVSDFENLNLSANTYWDGSDMSGTHNNGQFTSVFSSGTANFINVYDTTYGASWGFWSDGFAYSNMTDSTTSGSGNMYSTRAGIGAAGSSNFVVSANNSIIKLTGAALGTTVTGFYITNTTYAANSMRDGDSFGKQFGSLYDANGIPDGTNGEDWFRVSIWGYTAGNLTSDSVDFHLADYRFTNNALDYIVTDWQWVDLTSLGNVDSIYFKLASSDVGSFGINTPAFFCIDNFNDQSVGITDLLPKNKIDFYPNPATNMIVVKSTDNQILKLIDVTGKEVINVQIKEGTNNINLEQLPSGMYFVKLANNVARLIKQ